MSLIGLYYLEENRYEGTEYGASDVSHKLSWEEAEEACRLDNAKLAVITSVEENAFLVEKFVVPLARLSPLLFSQRQAILLLRLTAIYMYFSLHNNRSIRKDLIKRHLKCENASLHNDGQ